MYATRAGDVPRPTGAAAEAIIGANWPQISESSIDDVADSHQADADSFNSVGEVTRGDRSTQAQLLQGQAGDAHYRSMTDLMGHDFDAADHFASKALTAKSLASATRGAKMRLAQIMEAAGPEYDEAVNSGDPAAVAAVVAKYEPEVSSVMADAWSDLAQAPVPKPPPLDTTGATPLDNPTDGDRKKTEHQGSDKPDKPDGVGAQSEDTTKDGYAPGTSGSEDGLAPGTDALDDPKQGYTPPPSFGQNPPAIGPQQPQIPPVSMPTNPGASGGGLGGGSGVGAGGGLGSSGLGSVARPSVSPASLPTSSAGSLPTSPASAAPSAPLSNPISQATSQFQSGLSSGMGSSGAVPPAAFQQALQPYVSQQAVPVVADAGPAGGSGTPAAGAPGSAAAAAAGGAPVSHSGAPAGAGPLGGGGMLPPPVAGGAPLAPYSPPGSAGPAAPTAPAGSASVAPSPGAASAGAGPVLAGPAGAVGAAGASSLQTTNPDLIAAQEVLAGLVKACPNRPMFWAVAVLRTPVGPQTVIANSVGGGMYLPPEVRLPSTVRLAALDPALPFGWAAAWMGWQSPTAILVDHFERLSYVVAGVRVSAIATSELWPRRPDCGGDFIGVRHEELLRSSTSPLTGSHRLTGADPALAARLTALDRGGDMTSWVGSVLTSAVIRAAMEPDPTGSPVAVKEDADILDLVAQGAATPTHWKDYGEEVDRRGDGAVLMPEIYAPRDADDSPSTLHARMWYQHYFAMGRIAELVKLWASQPVSILDIAYCGIAAGFGGVVAAVVAEIETRLADMRAADDTSKR